MLHKTSLAFVVSIFFAACGGSTPKAAPPPEGTDEPASAESAAPAASGEAAEAPSSDKASEDKGEEKAAAPEMAPKLDKPASESTLAGKSLSSLDGPDLQGALKKLGWTKDEGWSGESGKAGSYEHMKLEIAKGKEKGYVEILRPAAEPGEASGASGNPSDEKATNDKAGAATYYDDAADVLVTVSVEGKTADAKKLLAKLVTIKKAKKLASAAKAAPAKKGAPAKKK